MKSTIFLILALASFTINISAQQKEDHRMNKDISTYQIGDKIEDFNLLNTDGEMISAFTDKNAKGYAIVFTSNVCPFAVASEDRLNQIHLDMEKMGYPIIAINSNIGDEENMAAMKEKVAEKQIKYTYLKDNSSVYKRFGATKTPHVFLVDNKMILQYMGSIDDSPRSPENVENKYLVDAINSLMNNQTPNPAVTKSIGCPIKADNKGGSKGRKGPPNPEEIIKKMDSNKDDRISKDEAKGPLSSDFDRLDTDKNGFLSIEELSLMKPSEGKSH